jgi:hypothetical protein
LPIGVSIDMTAQPANISAPATRPGTSMADLLKTNRGQHSERDATARAAQPGPTLIVERMTHGARSG